MTFPWFAVARALSDINEAPGNAANAKIVEMYRLCGNPQVKDDDTPWCAAFVGACLSLAGYQNTRSLLARSYLKHGRSIDRPEPGCIAVFSRTKDPALGHVGFYVSETAANIRVLGGNQGNRVKEEDYPRKRLLGYFLPVEIAPLPDTDELPTILEVDRSLAPPHVLAAASAFAAATISSRKVQLSDDREVAMNASDDMFLRLHAKIEQWEGGFVDHPADPGGATNMGITLDTLSRWKGRPVSKQEVRNLTKTEARQIFKAWYYDQVGADRMPAPVAMAVYNTGVLSGTGRAVRWLQETVNRLGGSIEVDGEFGPETQGAVARADPRSLANAYFDRYESFLLSLKHFPTFGNGWMNRLNDIRTFAATLPSTIVVQPQQPPEIMMPQQSDRKMLEALITLLLAGVVARKDGKSGPDLIGTLLQSLTGQLPAAPAGVQTLVPVEKPLTPVNGALGEGIGNALNGRKTGLGILGLLATSILPVISPNFAQSLGMDGGLGVGTDGGSVWTAVFSALTAWGVLGKTEKWVKEVKK